MDNPNTAYKDFYYILGVSTQATTTEINEAYKDLYEKFGPHVNVAGQDAESMLKAYRDIHEAYETLTDPALRKEYDQNYLSQQKSNLRDLWGRKTGPGERNKSDIESTVLLTEISLKEAIKGTQRELRIDEQIACKLCAGMKPVQRMQCTNCRGAGTTINPRFENVTFPPGLYDQAEIIIAGKGKLDLRSNLYPDLVIRIKIKQHQFFTVMGRDLTCTVPVTILEAVLGGEIQIPTAGGKVIMKIQPLTQSGRVYRLKGLGLAGADLLVTVDVIVPTQISVEELELYRKLQTASTAKNPREEIFTKLGNIKD